MQRLLTFTLTPLLFLVAWPGCANTELIGGDIKFTGTVQALPCSIAPGSEKIPVDFGTLSTKSLSGGGKSSPKAFAIHLQDCTSAVWNSVTVTFNGDRAANMNERLAIKPVPPGNASGIGIGLQESDGTEIKLGEPTRAVSISNANLQLDFAAFIEAGPDAVKNGTLSPGAFVATANYTLNYQ